MSQNGWNNCNWDPSWLNNSFINNQDSLTDAVEDVELLGEDIIFQTFNNEFTPSQEQMMTAVSDFFTSRNHDHEISTTCPTPAQVQEHLPPTGRIICNTNYPGVYDFFIAFDVQSEKQPKSINWTFSSKLGKLYVLKNTACPVQMGTKIPPPYGSVIRSILIFNKDEYLQDPVKRCITHRTDEPEGVNLMISDMTDHQEVTDLESRRDSIVLPFSTPGKGMDRSTYIYKFMCLGSCVGGPNRRSMQLIFTLESPSGEVLGRRVVNLRICACPGRDRKNEEAQYDTTASANDQAKQEQEARGLKRTVSGEFTMMGPLNKKKTAANGPWALPHLFEVREDFEAVKKVVDSLVTSFKMRHQLAGSSNNVPAPVRAPSITPITLPPIPASPITNGDPATPSCSGMSSSPTPANEEVKPITIDRWLASIGMEAYTSTFTSKGVQMVSDMEEWTLAHMDSMRIGQSHSMLIWNALQEYLASRSQSSSQDTTASGSGMYLVRHFRYKYTAKKSSDSETE